jgi:hypothetical protein
VQVFGTGRFDRISAPLERPPRELTLPMKELTSQITLLISATAPALIAIPGRGASTAAKILGETAGVDRSHLGTRSPDRPGWHRRRSGHRTTPATD